MNIYIHEYLMFNYAKSNILQNINKIGMNKKYYY